MKCPFCNYESNVISDVCVNCEHELNCQDVSSDDTKRQMNAYKWFSSCSGNKISTGLKNASKLTRASIKEDKPLYKVWVQTSCENPCHTLANKQKVPLDEEFLVVDDDSGAVSMLNYPGEYGHNTGCCSCEIAFTDNPEGVLSESDKTFLFNIAKSLQSKFN